MAHPDMIKQAYAEGAFAALKEAGYDDQTAANVAWKMAEQGVAAPHKAPHTAPPPRTAPPPALKGHPLNLAGTAGQPAAPAFRPPARPQ